MKLQAREITTDVLVIGGGTAGCYAALTLAAESEHQVLIAEKANIKRSGCLAAGVNALNAYIVKGQTPETYLEYVRQDSAGLLREDLVLTAAQRLNAVTAKMEGLGLVIQKEADGSYAARGNRNIKINGENIKLLLADAVEAEAAITVLNRVNIIDYIVDNGRVLGAYGFSLDEEILYVITAKVVICATGGAAGLYRPNNPGFSRHKMWYSPFNTGAGYAMGIRAGAEMTTFEMRFIALRCKDTIAPTGTIAQGVRAEQVNSLGEEYERKYGRPATCNRLYSTVAENRQGRGPCYLQTQGITDKQEQELYKAYLNMAPAQTLRWLESGTNPAAYNVEIEGTEPYIVGGHTASGYWVDTKRATTLPGLYAAGDVAGGSPQKYVTGCFAEGEIAAQAVAAELATGSMSVRLVPAAAAVAAKLAEVNQFLVNPPDAVYTVEEVEAAMQKIMDEYAGGIATGYVYNAERLRIAEREIRELQALVATLAANDLHQLMFIYELKERLDICQVLIAHLAARKETRWHSFQENADYPNADDANWLKYVNSKQEAGEIRIVFRELVTKDEMYEHKN